MKPSKKKIERAVTAMSPSERIETMRRLLVADGQSLETVDGMDDSAVMRAVLEIAERGETK